METMKLEGRQSKASLWRLLSRTPVPPGAVWLQRFALASLLLEPRAPVPPAASSILGPAIWLHNPTQIFRLCSKAKQVHQCQPRLCPEPWQRLCEAGFPRLQLLLCSAHVCCHTRLQGDSQSRSSGFLPCSCNIFRVNGSLP